MKAFARIAVATVALCATGATFADVTFYEHAGFRGGSLTLRHALENFGGTRFDDRVSSIVVRGGAWEFCEDVRFRGQCVVLRPGRYRSMGAMGLNDRLSSARPARREPPRAWR